MRSFLQVKDWKSRQSVFKALNEVMYLKKSPAESVAAFLTRAQLFLEEKYAAFSDLPAFVNYHRKHYSSPKRLSELWLHISALLNL